MNAFGLSMLMTCAGGMKARPLLSLKIIKGKYIFLKNPSKGLKNYEFKVLTRGFLFDFWLRL